MITKMGAIDAKVDWDAVSRATELPRTYLIKDRSTGREFFKMYKPSEAQRIFKAQGWIGQIVSVLDRRRH